MLSIVGIGDHLLRVYHSGILKPFSRPLSLASPPWVDAMSAGNGFIHPWGRNGKFCLAVGPVSRTVGHLYYCMSLYFGLTLTGS